MGSYEESLEHEGAVRRMVRVRDESKEGCRKRKGQSGGRGLKEHKQTGEEQAEEQRGESQRGRGLARLEVPCLHLGEAVAADCVHHKRVHQLMPASVVVLVRRLLDALVVKLEPNAARWRVWVHHGANSAASTYRASVASAVWRQLRAVAVPAAVGQERWHEGKLDERSYAGAEQEIPSRIDQTEVVAVGAVSVEGDHWPHVVVEEAVAPHGLKA
eukprot:4464945-Pleurochrysis_carterae.AAC.2